MFGQLKKDSQEVPDHYLSELGDVNLEDMSTPDN